MFNYFKKIYSNIILIILNKFNNFTCNFFILFKYIKLIILFNVIESETILKNYFLVN